MLYADELQCSIPIKYIFIHIHFYITLYKKRSNISARHFLNLEKLLPASPGSPVRAAHVMVLVTGKI